MGREIVEVFESSNQENKLPDLSLNHVSFICKSVRRSVKFYEEVLGFVLIKRPSSFDFEGAWLFNHGIGIHLLGAEKIPQKKGKINPKDNHISFQCTDMDLIILKLEEMNIEYVKAVVKEVLPLSAPSFPIKTTNLKNSSSFYGKMQCSGEVEALMMENLAMEMMDISI
ncbi:unnamed protein product [Fraxinus pennsylvanica]|uniref:VOC domain-containing protein n=1 Tax=Fraxinus pennsylvanica TaxID=56036 RepID=A0AAD2E0B5_9LAMI|nr:unnamed protein product [Fraxinus pennsylvanica]